MGLLSPHYICTALLACMHAAYLPACATGIRSGSPHDVLHRTSDNDNNGGGISYVLLNAHARSLRGEFKGQSRQESRTREIVAVLNRLNIGRYNEELRIEHGTL